jgi:hypothetical protein
LLVVCLLFACWLLVVACSCLLFACCLLVVACWLLVGCFDINYQFKISIFKNKNEK